MTIRGCNRPRIRAVGLSGAIATFGGQSFWNACQVFVSGQPSLASQKRTLAHDLKRSGYIDEWWVNDNNDV